MQFSVLASGSRANCTFLEISGRRILIDCGLSAKRIEQALIQCEIAPSSLEAIFVTHEHSDHIAGLRVFSKRYGIPCWANRRTLERVGDCYAKEVFTTGKDLEVFPGVSIHPFSVVHDAVDPVGFRIDSDEGSFGIVTDFGKATPLVKVALCNVHALVIESNFDEQLLRDCEYPWQLKQRISSSHGHLSNRHCGDLLEDLVHPELSSVVLAHLSENSNTPERALASSHKACSRYGVKLLAGSPRQPLAPLHLRDGRLSTNTQEICESLLTSEATA